MLVCVKFKTLTQPWQILLQTKARSLLQDHIMDLVQDWVSACVHSEENTLPNANVGTDLPKTCYKISDISNSTKTNNVKYSKLAVYVPFSIIM